MYTFVDTEHQISVNVPVVGLRRSYCSQIFVWTINFSFLEREEIAYNFPQPDTTDCQIHKDIENLTSNQIVIVES